jgi:hypothetical protein
VSLRQDAKKPALSPAFPFASLENSYLRLRAALRAAFFRARVRAPLRADALRAALLPLRGAFFFAAAILSLHDEVESSLTPWWNPRFPASRPDRPRVTKELTATIALTPA